MKKRNIVILVFAAAAVISGFLRVSAPADPPKLWNREIKITGRFVPEASPAPVQAPFKRFEIEKAMDDETDEELNELRDKEIDIKTGLDPEAEKEYELLVRTGRDRTRLNPSGGKESKLYGTLSEVISEGEEVYSLPGMFNMQRSALNSYILKKFKPDSAALVASVTTGEMSYLSPDMKNAFSVTGLAHILSISGSHFGLFSVMLFGCFAFLVKRLPYKFLQRLTLYLTPSQTAAILCIPFMVTYLGLSGASPPAVRSFIMITLFLAGMLLGRKGFWLNSLLFAAFLLVIWNPGVILSLSFQLSFIAVAFIGFSVGEKEEAQEISKGRPVADFAKNSLKLTLAASIGTFPLVAYHFHYLSIISPLANLLVSPLIGFILVPLSVVSSFSFLATGCYAFAPLVSASADLSVSLVRFLSGIPYSALSLRAFPPALCLLFYGFCLLYLFFGKRKKLLILPFIPFLIYAVFLSFQRRDLSVTFLDVGQGDSSVVELPDGRTVVIDSGRTGRETADFLKYIGKQDIDALVLTHIHPDHSGGLQYLSDRFRVKEIWDSGMISYPFMLKTPRRQISRGDIIEAGDCSFTVLHPYKEFYTSSENTYEEENNSSIVLRLSGRKHSFLFSGDIEEEAEDDVSRTGKWCRSDIVKIPHHGSRTSANESFIRTVAGSAAVISAGRDNPYGHPNPEFLHMLNGIKIYRTDLNGAVKVIETEKGLAIKTYNEFLLKQADGIKTEVENIRKLSVVW